MTKNEVNINEILKQEFLTPVSIYDGKYTKTTQFMLPSVGVNVKNKLIFKYFINSYLDDKGKVHDYERPVFVLFGVKDFNDKDWQKVYAALLRSPNYKGDYDCGIQDELNLVMLVFKVPDDFESDYYHFKRGRYSRFSDAYKEKFPRFIGDDDNKGKESIIWQVINRSPILRKQIEDEFNMPEGELDKATDGTFAKDIWDIPRKNREYYRYESSISAGKLSKDEKAVP